MKYMCPQLLSFIVLLHKAKYTWSEAVTELGLRPDWKEYALTYSMRKCLGHKFSQSFISLIMSFFYFSCLYQFLVNFAHLVLSGEKEEAIQEGADSWISESLQQSKVRGASGIRCVYMDIVGGKAGAILNPWSAFEAPLPVGASDSTLGIATPSPALPGWDTYSREWSWAYLSHSSWLPSAQW